MSGDQLSLFGAAPVAVPGPAPAPFDLLALITSGAGTAEAVSMLPETAAPTPTTGPRNAVSCRRCATWYVVPAEQVQYVAGPSGWAWREVVAAGDTVAPCPVCGGRLEDRGEINGGRVTVTYTDSPCDYQCTGARGTECDCRCGGRNHGSHREVTVTVDKGAAPRIELADEARWRRQAARTLADVERYEAVRDEVRAELDRRYGAIARRREAGEWIAERDYGALRDRWAVDRALHHAAGLKTPANRLRAVEQLRDRLTKSDLIP